MTLNKFTIHFLKYKYSPINGLVTKNNCTEGYLITTIEITNLGYNIMCYT